MNIQYLITNKILILLSIPFSIFLEHEFNSLEDVWFTSAPNLTVHTVEVGVRRIVLLFQSCKMIPVSVGIYSY